MQWYSRRVSPYGEWEHVGSGWAVQSNYAEERNTQVKVGVVSWQEDV